MTSSEPHDLPKASSPNTRGVRALPYEFWGDTIQPAAAHFLVSWQD